MDDGDVTRDFVIGGNLYVGGQITVGGDIGVEASARAGARGRRFSASVNFGAPEAVPGCTPPRFLSPLGVSVPQGAALAYSPPVEPPASMFFSAYVDGGGRLVGYWAQLSGAPKDPDGGRAHEYSVIVLD
jgi:hypothetical protein